MTMTPEIEIKIRRLTFILLPVLFKNQVRNTKYRDYPDVISSTMDLRMMATYKF